MTRRRIALIASMLLSVLALSLFIVKTRPDKPASKTTDTEVAENGTIEDRLANIPKDAQSDVCDSLKKEDLAKATDSVILAARPSLVTTKTTDGTVSACTYIMKQGENSMFQYIVVTSRVFTNSAKAQQSFDLLANAKSPNTKRLDQSTIYNASVAQIVRLTRSKLSTVNIERVDKRKTISEPQIQSLLKLL